MEEKEIEKNYLNMSQDELKVELQKLSKEFDEASEKVGTAEYKLTISSLESLKKVREFLDKVYWSAKNANVIVHLAEFLDSQIEANKNVKGKLELTMNQMNVTFLYQILVSIQDSGVETAKLYVELIDELGAELTNIMNEVGIANKVLQDKANIITNIENLLADTTVESVEETSENKAAAKVVKLH